MTTLGYGDYVPLTPAGYVVGSMCAVVGIIFTALPIPVIVNNFTLYYSHVKARKKLKDPPVRQNYLPNRAVAMHFQSNDVRFDLDKSKSQPDVYDPKYTLNTHLQSKVKLCTKIITKRHNKFKTREKQKPI